MFKKQIPSDTVSNRSIADKELKENTLVDTVPNKLLATLDTLVKGVGNNLLFRGANVIPDRIFAQTEDEAEQEKIDKLKKLALLNNTNDGQRLVKQDYDMNAKKILSAGGVDQYPEENLKNIYSALSDDDKQRLSKELQEEEEAKIMDIGGMTAGITRAEKVLGRGAGKVANAIAGKIIDPTESGRAMRDYHMINDYLFHDMGARKEARKKTGEIDLKFLDNGADRAVYTSNKHPNQVLKTPSTPRSFARGNTIREQVIANELNELGLGPAVRSYVVGGREFQTQTRVLPYGSNMDIVDDALAKSTYGESPEIARQNLVDEINASENIVANDVHEGNWGISSPFQTKFDEALKLGASKMSKTGEMHPDIVQANIKPEILELLKSQSEKMRVEPGTKLKNTAPIVFDTSRFGGEVGALLHDPAAFERLKRTIKTTNPQVREAIYLAGNNTIPPEIAAKAREAAKAKKVQEFNDMFKINGKNREELEPFIRKLEQLAGENAGNKKFDELMYIRDQIKAPYAEDIRANLGDMSQYNTNELIHAAVNNDDFRNTLYKDDALAELYNRLMNKTSTAGNQPKLFGETEAINNLKFNSDDFRRELFRLDDKAKAQKMIGDLMPVTKVNTADKRDVDQLGMMIQRVKNYGETLNPEDQALYQQLREKVGAKLKDRRREAYKKVKK